MNLRCYAPNDWDRICEIHDQARLDELKASGLTEAFLTLQQTAENEGLFKGDVFVAEYQQQVYGFVAYSNDELTWLYVDPKMYKQGVGRLLLRHAIQACNGTISTEVLVGNTPALELYLSEGFKVVHRSDGKLAGNESFTASGYVLQRNCNEA
jgi:GNAT superfamily N-acetyltransferase